MDLIQPATTTTTTTTITTTTIITSGRLPIQWLGRETHDLWIQLTAMTLPGYFWDRWPPLASKLSWDVTTTQVNLALHPSGVTKSSSSFDWGEGGKSSLPGGR